MYPHDDRGRTHVWPGSNARVIGVVIFRGVAMTFFLFWSVSAAAASIGVAGGGTAPTATWNKRARNSRGRDRSNARRCRCLPRAF